MSKTQTWAQRLDGAAAEALPDAGVTTQLDILSRPLPRYITTWNEDLPVERHHEIRKWIEAWMREHGPTP